MAESKGRYGTIGNIVLEDGSLGGDGSHFHHDHVDDDRTGPIPIDGFHPMSELPDKYEPAYHSLSRRSNLLVAVFNLLSTIVGGGTLSLPYAFSKCGYMGGTILVIGSVFISIISLKTLCILARKHGTTKYSEVSLFVVATTWPCLLENYAVLVVLLTYY